MPSSPEQLPQFADIKELKKEVEPAGFEIEHTPDLDKAVEKADEIAKAIQEDKPVTLGQFLDMKEALERAIESDPGMEAKRLFGEGYFGPNEIEKYFTLENGEKLFEYSLEARQKIYQMLREKLSDPQIRDLIKRTSREELRQRFQLFLFPDKFKDGTPVTMKSLCEKFQPEMERRGMGKLILNVSLYETENFFKSDTNTLSWKLLSKGNLIGSTGRDYVEGTIFFRNYLRQENLAQADELADCNDARIKELAQLMTKDLKKSSIQLSELIINQKYRINPLEVIFLHIVKKSGLAESYTWTAKRFDSNVLISVGRCNSAGAIVLGWAPDDGNDFLGVSLSR